jgi:hypothetical protein
MDTKVLTIAAIAAVASPLLSLGISVLARALFLWRTPELAREHLREIEETARRVAALRKAHVVSQRELEEVLKQVVTSSLTEDRGKRLIHELGEVRVDGDSNNKKYLLWSAERLLRNRFAAPTRAAGTPVIKHPVG